MSAPDFTYSAFYYQQQLEALLRLKATSWPEHTETDAHDPAVQLLRLWALVGHLQACRLDHTARELYLPTLRLRSSLIALARLVDYELDPPTPSEVDLLASISGKLTTSTTLVKAHNTFGTSGGVLFEFNSDDELAAGPTGSPQVFEDDGGTFTDRTAGLPVTPWGAGPVENDALLFRSGGAVMFDRLALEVGDADGFTVRWEYHDDLRALEPDLVAVLGGGLRFLVGTAIGTTPADGLTVTITCKANGVSTTGVVYYDPGAPGGPANTVEIATFLGQGSPSGSVGDYLISGEWFELPDLVDGTEGLTTSGTVAWSFPQDEDRRWAPSDSAATGSDDYEVRARVVDPAAATAPLLDGVSEARKTAYAVLIPVQQGQRVEDKLGTTDGSASQWFELAREPFMALVGVTVNGVDWTQVATFLQASSLDRVFTLRERPDGAWRLTFGDGTNGKIPDSSVQVVATYRIGGDTSGNVGINAITRDRSGNSKISAVANPRAATGWVAAEGSDEASLDVAREAVPASLHTLQRAVTPDDCADLALEFTTADGSQVAERVLALEEAYGLKTIGLVVVGPAGTVPTTSDLAELDAYFNGDLVGLQRLGGVLLANHELTSEPVVLRSIDVTATITVLADYADSAKAKIEAALQSILHPLAKRMLQDDSGAWAESTSYLWEWGDNGGEVARGMLIAAIVTSANGIANVAIAVPAADVSLAAGELPTVGALSITIVSL